MNLQRYVTGFVLGAGSAALGMYVYSKNKEKIHDFMKSQGIDIPMAGNGTSPAAMSLEDLVREKERLEDIIAEREMAAKGEGAEPSDNGKGAAKEKKAAAK